MTNGQLCIHVAGVTTLHACGHLGQSLMVTIVLLSLLMEAIPLLVIFYYTLYFLKGTRGS